MLNERAMIRKIHQARTARWLVLIGATTLLSNGCSMDDLLGADELPPEVTDPAITHTPAGARAVYNGAVVSFRSAFAGATSFGPAGSGSAASVIAMSGVMTDELHATSQSAEMEDMRFLPESDSSTSAIALYSRLQRARGQASQAIELLRRFDPDGASRIGHAYALEGYTEIFLAEFFCSGVPLSTLDFDGDFTYRPGSTTEQVLERAIAHFDSAAVHAGDSIRVVHLANLGRGRALLGLGRFAEAANAVSAVPDDFVYAVTFQGGTNSDQQAFTRQSTIGARWDLSVADQKGINGIDFLSSADPRTQATIIGQSSTRGFAVYFPSKYPSDASGAFALASGIEARLVEAEAALRAGDVDTWLDKLNHLRRTAWSTITPALDGPLPDLADPGTDGTRVDLMFRERALWLFLTGQRQGDLRRLVRHYGRPSERVYPIGEFPGPGGRSYGNDIDLPIPPAERLANPYFDGCLVRGV